MVKIFLYLLWNEARYDLFLCFDSSLTCLTHEQYLTSSLFRTCSLTPKTTRTSLLVLMTNMRSGVSLTILHHHELNYFSKGIIMYLGFSLTATPNISRISFTSLILFSNAFIFPYADNLSPSLYRVKALLNWKSWVHGYWDCRRGLGVLFNCIILLFYWRV